MTVDGHGLEAQQLRQGAHKDVGPGGEEVGPEKAVPMGAAALGHAVEQAHQLLQRQLELSRLVLEPGDGENPDQRGAQQQKRRCQQGGNHPRVHRHQAEQADLSRAVEHRVPHGLLHALRRPGGPGHQRGDEQQNRGRQTDR